MRTVLLVTAFLTSAGFAQEPGSSPPTKVPAPEVVPAPAAQVDATAKWIQQLGSDSYRDRQEAEHRLREMGDKARGALEAAAKDSRDGEAQWRAKRLLRQLDKAGLAERSRGDQDPTLVPRRPSRDNADEDARAQDRQRMPAIGGIEDMRAEFDRLFRRIEAEHGLDVPRHRFFGDTFFKDLQSQLDTGSNGRSVSVQVTPDGVHVEVTETGKDGKPETKTYDAKDMKSFHEKYPGVLSEAQGGLGLRAFGREDLGEDLREDIQRMRLEIGAPQPGFTWRMAPPKLLPRHQGWRGPERGVLPQPQLDDADEDAVAGPVVPPPGARLGVAVQPIPDVLRDYLELDADTGLMVAAVQADTLAASLQLRAGDIVTTINGAKIASPADVQKALSSIKKGEAVKVTFLRRGERRDAETEKREEAAPARAEIPSGKRERESIR